MVNRWLDRLRTPSRFERWRKKNPSKPFKAFFAETVERKLRDGKRHKSLGANLRGDEFGLSGRGFFENLVKSGLRPDDTCVDYGCGTLRIGVHLINYLRAGGYWGLDISKFLLDEGRSLIGDQLWAEKQPHLHVISEESVAEAAGARPAMLISTKVLIHVHPDELEEFFQNVIRIITPSGQAIIVGKWSDTATIQYSERSWAHGMRTLEDRAKQAGGSIELIEGEEREIAGAELTARWGKFRIVPGN